MVARQLNVIERTLSPFNNIRFSSEGEDRVDLAHPSCASRIRKIEQALSARGIDLRTLASQEEEDKIKKLGEFFFEEKYFKNLGDNCEPVPEL